MTAAAKPDPLQHLANKVNDHSTVLQAIQVDMQHMVKAIDKLVGVSEKQAVLGSELQRHSESIDRAFRQMDGHKSELTQAIRELAEAFKADRKDTADTANEVAGFKGSIRALRWALGIVAGVAIFAGGVVMKGIQADQARTDATATDLRADFERRKLAVDIKIDALSQSVQEVRLDRQRDLEDKQAKP
jgi:Skp family chaperone for outer membrane proteins